MNDFTMPLILDLDVVSLTMSLVNIESPTGAEGGLADSIEQALASRPHLTVERVGNSVLARSAVAAAAGSTPDSTPDSARETTGRVLVAGHIDTRGGEPGAMAFVEMGKLFGAGACDAKGGIAVMLKAALATYDREVTFLFHEGGEGGGEGGDGLAALVEAVPGLLDVDRVVLVEPTDGAFAETSTLPGCSSSSALAPAGVPTVYFGPGDAQLAHAVDEFVPTAELTQGEFDLRTWLQVA